MREKIDGTLVRNLVDIRDRTLQKNRIAFGNRIDAYERGVDTGNKRTRAVLQRWYEKFLELERMADDDIREAVKDEPIYKQLRCVKGIGPMLSAKLIAMIDIHRAHTVSSLWRYAGLAVVPTGYRLVCGHEVALDVSLDSREDDVYAFCGTCKRMRAVKYRTGQRERPTKGERLRYNKRLKTTLYLIGTSFLRSGSPYRRIYDDARAYYDVNRSNWTKAHRHQAAMRKMVKVFLQHVWVRWRALEGLPTRELYVFKFGESHTHYYAPEEFGWPPEDVLQETGVDGEKIGAF